MEPDQVMAPTELSFAADAIAVLKEVRKRGLSLNHWLPVHFVPSTALTYSDR